MRCPRLAALVLALSLSSMAAQAQLFRAYVKSTGSDANPCTLQAPCRLLPAALAAVAGGGEVWMLDSANYNTDAVVLDKSVSIAAVPGVVGSLVSSGPAGAIQVPIAGLSVFLRNIAIGPLPGAALTAGVVASAASTVALAQCQLGNLRTGIQIAGARVQVVDSLIRDTSYGIRATASGRVDVASTRIMRFAIAAISLEDANSPSQILATVSDSSLAGSERSAGVGIQVVMENAASAGKASVTRSSVRSAGTGVFASAIGGGSATAVVSQSALSDVGRPALAGAGGVVVSMQNNQFADSDTASINVTGGAPQ